MANPNIVNVTTIYGNTSYLSVNTVTQNVVSNPASSSSVYKINSLLVSNYSTNNYTVTSQINNSGSNTYIINSAVVPANSTLTLIGKDNQIYLLENVAIQMVSNFATALNAICSFEQIS